MPIRPSQTTNAVQEVWGLRRKAVGARIRQLRIAHGLTQEAVGLEAGLSRNMIIGIEWGRKSVAYERLFDIAHVLGVSVTDLLIAADKAEQGHTDTAASADEN